MIDYFSDGKQSRFINICDIPTIRTIANIRRFTNFIRWLQCVKNNRDPGVIFEHMARDQMMIAHLHAFVTVREWEYGAQNNGR